MKERYLSSLIEEFCFKDHKMAFVSGPRQCGKTTLAKTLLNRRSVGAYFNWDESEFRRIWTKNPSQIIPETDQIPMVVLDEIHKAKLWKRTLKGVYDTLAAPADIVVTGSARLNVYNKGSDSLLGRYFHFRLHPFTLREMVKNDPVRPKGFIESIFSRLRPVSKNDQENLEALFRFGGFPEPLFSRNERKARLWRASRVEKVIREDLRDLSRIPELSQIEMLASLLPEKVGSLFSIVSVKEDLEVSFQTVKRWIDYLKELYYLFEVKPFHRSIVRSLKKEGKIYLWDYGEIQDPAARFENLTACHLLKTCHYWTDGGEGNFDLFYLRDKEKHEIDFLITKDGKPWLPIEVKLNDATPSPHWKKFLNQMPCREAIQIVKTPRHWKIHSFGDRQILVASAGELLGYFI
ncbi:MAG: ATP-binding protein [Candidatus Omnitrophica bacterium]|nr:ATP-binding protein [Candidatus Omnitrophota bacterium]